MSQESSNKKFWGKVAKLYAPTQERTNAKLYRELNKIISKFLNKNMSVLELACGTGQLTLSLYKEAATWEATDFSENMIEEAKSRAIDIPVAFTVQDATNLPYEDEKFDTVIIANALHIMPNPDKALTEIRRILKIGGQLIAPTFVYDGKIKRIQIWMMEMIGFRTFNKWKSDEYTEFVCKKGFNFVYRCIIDGNPLPECVLVCKT